MREREQRKERRVRDKFLLKQKNCSYAWVIRRWGYFIGAHLKVVSINSLHTVTRNQNLAFWYPVRSMQIDPTFTSNISGGFLLWGGHFSLSEMSKQEKFSKFMLFYDLKH